MREKGVVLLDKTLPSTSDVSAYFIVLGLHDVEAQARPARTE